MRIGARSAILLLLCVYALPFAGAQSRIDTSKIDAALGRSGTWIEGQYVVNFPRPDLRVMREGVQLSTAHVVSFVTFMGDENNNEVMGEICALPNEVTPAISKLRAGKLEITGVHNHFVGESPRLMFIHFMKKGHFMARGRAAGKARAFREALVATTTPLGEAPGAAMKPEPEWAKAVERALGREGIYLAGDQTLEVDVPSADFAPGPMDF